MDLSKKITFVRFCFASASMLEENLRLPTEQLICLYKECIEMAKHCYDIRTMMDSCVEFVLHSNSIGRHADSLRCLKKILPSVVAIPSCELIVHSQLSTTYMKLKEYDKVVLQAKKWIKIARNIGDKENEMYGHFSLGMAFSLLDLYDDAIDCGKKCLEIAQETNFAKGRVMAYQIIMGAYKYMKKHNDTIVYAHKVLDYARKINNQEAMMTANFELGEAHLALKHYQEATDFGKKCIEIAREIGDRGGEVLASQLMGMIYKALSDYENAIIYWRKSIELAITIGDKHAEAYAYSILGEIYYDMGKYDDAISNCNKCIHIDKEDDEGRTADVTAYFTLGEVNKSLEKYDEGIQNYKQGIDIGNSIDREKEAVLRACLHLGEIYQTLEQYSDGVNYYKQCVDMGNRIGREKEAVGRACLHLGEIYQTLEQYSDAVHYYKQCIDMALEIDDKNSQMNGHLFLAKVYLKSMQMNDAFLSIDASVAIAKELGNKEAEKICQVLLSQLYAAVYLPDKLVACDVPFVKELSEIRTCSEDDLLEDLAQAGKTDDKISKIMALSKLNLFYFSKKDYLKSINCLEQLKEMNTDLSLKLWCFTEIGKSYRFMGQDDMALRCFKEGLPTAESCHDNEQKSHFYFYLGQLLFSMNRELDLAERYVREAIRCFEVIFTNLGSLDEFKISIFDHYIGSYKILAMLLIKGKHFKDALLVLDRCRARALKDLMISNLKMEQEESTDDHLEYSDVLSLVSRNDFSIAYYSFCPNVLLKYFFVQKDDTLCDEMGVQMVFHCDDRSLDKE